MINLKIKANLMNIFIFILLVVPIICSNINNTTENEFFLPTYKKCQIDERLHKFIKEFTKENNCLDCIYELYINKIGIQYYIITLKAISNSNKYYSTINPLEYIYIDNIKIYVFSGVEDFFKGDKQNNSNHKNDVECKYKLWNIFFNGDSVKVVKNKATLPYIEEDLDVADNVIIDTVKWEYMPSNLQKK